jgi:outer membrane protein
MAGAARFCATSMIAILAATPVTAADLATPMEPLPPPPPIFFVHAGALGAFAETNAQATGGGSFGGAENVAIQPVYTLVLEAGYYVTPNIAITFGTAVPPVSHFKATGLPAAPILGTNLLGSARYGDALLLLQYHFSQFGPLQPYAGIGVGYALNFGNFSDGILRNFYWDQNFAFVLQAGTDYMFTPNWGVFVDGKKVLFSTDSGGFAITSSGLLPVRAHVTVDPWVADVGITFKY